MPHFLPRDRFGLYLTRSFLLSQMKYSNERREHFSPDIDYKYRQPHARVPRPDNHDICTDLKVQARKNHPRGKYYLICPSSDRMHQFEYIYIGTYRESYLALLSAIEKTYKDYSATEIWHFLHRLKKYQVYRSIAEFLNNTHVSDIKE